MTALEECTNLTLAELKLISYEEISLWITKEEAMYISKRSLDLGEASAMEISNIWMNKLLRAYSTSGLCSVQDWQLMLNYLRTLLDQMLVNLLPGIHFISWSSDALEFVKWLRTLISKLKMECVLTALYFFLETNIVFLNFCHENVDQEDLNQLVENSLNIHNETLCILSESFNSSEMKEFTNAMLLSQLITKLCDIGEFGRPFDIRTIVETWKVIVKICIRNSKCLKVDSKRDWAKRPLTFLHLEVARNVTTVFSEDTLLEPVEQIEKLLRITNFYIKLMLSLTAEIECLDFPVVDIFFETLLSYHLIPSHIIGTEKAELVDKYVGEEMCKMLLYIYKNPTFIKLFSNYVKENNSDQSSITLAMQYLSCCLKDCDYLYIEENNKIFTKLFAQSFQGVTNFIDFRKYDKLIELFAGLTIISPSPLLRNYIQEMVFNANFILAHASSDVLLTTLRCQIKDINSIAPKNEFRYWRSLNDKFSVFSNCQQQLYIQRLLRNCYKLCTSYNKINENDLLAGTLNKDDNLWNFRLLECICEEISSYELQRSLAQKHTEDLYEMIDGCTSVDFSVHNYYRMIADVKMITLLTQKADMQLLEKLFDLFARIIEHSYFQYNAFSTFVTACFDLAAKGTEIVQFDILNCIKQNSLIIKKKIDFPALANFLHVCLFSTNNELKSEATTVIIRSSESDKNALYCTHVFAADLNDGAENNIEIYNTLHHSAISFHMCAEIQKAKRLRFD